ncbi:methylated-DNA--[protein]-cysteine S-methyltransferase [Salinimicrobium soli]|uniref:methylated-DNA--[protein]-cysteine S-methyltransferase n=1 Tax=Salinimicrobium soli TaxID=1254399 RepID=UPI003AB02D24
MTSRAVIDTPLGTAILEGDEKGLISLSLSEENPGEINPEILRHAVVQLREYFEGTRKEFDLPLNPQGTDFQKRVWELLLEIPFGSTCSYMDLAKQYGDPKAIRAIASANGKNPLWILVPCHRVIGSDGSLTGYAGGLWRKKWLLDHENPSTQQSLF